MPYFAAHFEQQLELYKTQVGFSGQSRLNIVSNRLLLRLLLTATLTIQQSAIK